jgi:hypothetical protein
LDREGGGDPVLGTDVTLELRVAVLDVTGDCLRDLHKVEHVKDEVVLDRAECISKIKESYAGRELEIFGLIYDVVDGCDMFQVS